MGSLCLKKSGTAESQPITQTETAGGGGGGGATAVYGSVVRDSGPPLQTQQGDSLQQQQKGLQDSVLKSSTSLSSSAKPLGQFTYLKKSYTIKTPSCLVPRINELFKSICDRYDVAVVNREKVDEALTLFKQVVGVDKMASMEATFTAWKESLTGPRFTVNFKEETGHIKEIKVKADNIPREKRKAQKHIRDLIDACNLYLQQRDFLQRQIAADLVQLDGLTNQLQTLGKEIGLSSSERKQLPKTFGMAREQFSEFSSILDMFFTHISSLMKEINTSVHVLGGRESSTEFH